LALLRSEEAHYRRKVLTELAGPSGFLSIAADANFTDIVVDFDIHAYLMASEAGADQQRPRRS
jgi:hypothetical protein